MSATVVTHGCRSNLAEADALARLAPTGSIVINSCAVTSEAVRDARAAARRALGDGQVIVTGCAASVAPERFADLPVWLVPAAEKLSPQRWGREGASPIAASRRSRAFLAIQDGCDHRCTFCVTTLARGASRSLPPEQVIAAARRLAATGVAELVLTGIDTTSYGRDLADAPTLGGLIRRLLAEVPGLQRLRLSSLDAAEADTELIGAFADSRLMPHVHLSLQHGSDAVLKRMARRHRRADALALIAALRAVRPDIAVGADLIAGFPGETAAQHGESLALIADAGLAHAHVFPYSPRPGTAAALWPMLPVAVIRARAAALRVEAAHWHRRFLAGFVGRPVQIVSEGSKGISPHGFSVVLPQPVPRGALAEVVPMALNGDRLAA